MDLDFPEVEATFARGSPGYMQALMSAKHLWVTLIICQQGETNEAPVTFPKASS